GRLAGRTPDRTWRRPAIRCGRWNNGLALHPPVLATHDVISRLSLGSSPPARDKIRKIWKIRRNLPVDLWPHFTVFAAVEVTVTVCAIRWVLMTKRDPQAAMAWCLVVLLVPLIGATLFWMFGHQRVNRPLGKRRQHRFPFRIGHPPRTREA